jgi:hypothetical protein
MSPHFKWFLAGVAIVFVAAYLMGCASSGLYAMSDEWCDSHPGASPAHCSWKHEQQPPRSDTAQLEPQPVVTVGCKGPVSITFGDTTILRNTPEWQHALFALYYYEQHGGEYVIVNTCKDKP